MKFGEDDYIYWFMSKSWHVSVSRYKKTLKLRHVRSNVIVNALTLSIVLVMELFYPFSPVANNRVQTSRAAYFTNV